MWDFMTRPVAQVVLWVAALLVLMTISYYALRRYRDRIDDDVRGPNEWLVNFREMHAEGDISEREFRKVKTVLDEKVEQEPDPAEPEKAGSDGS